MDPTFDIRRIEVMDEATADMYRRMTPGQRLRLGLDASEFAARMSEAGVRYQHPAWSDEDVRKEVLRRQTRAAG